MGNRRRAGQALAAALSAAAIVMCAGPAAAGAETAVGNATANTTVGGIGPGLNDMVGQTFTAPPAPDTFLHSLSITGLNRVSSAPNQITVAAVSGGIPTTVLFTGPAITGPSGLAPVTVYPNLTLMAGQQYAFYADGTDGTGFFGTSNPGLYPGGDIIRHTISPPAPAAAWETASNQDAGFLANFSAGATDTLTTVSCPGPGKIGVATACTGTLKDAASGNGFAGSVALGTVFLTGGFSSCNTDGSGDCSFNFTPTASGSGSITGQYLGNPPTRLGSGGNTSFTVGKRTSAQSAAGCTPTTVHVGETTTCSVTVSDTDTGTKTTPAGATSWSSTGAGTFSSGGACTLSAQSLGVSKCAAITYTPTAAGTPTITSAYGGDGNHLAAANASAGNLTVLPAPIVAPLPLSPAPDCSAALAKIASTQSKLKKAHGAKKKKLRKKLKRLRGDAAALGC